MLAWKRARDLASGPQHPVPPHLRNAPTALMRAQGYGKGYLYPHDYADADVDQEYLPDELVGRVFYEPSDQGLEIKIGERLQRLRRRRLDERLGEKRTGISD